MADYDVVFLGYPIWHGQAPRIISTFLESYDFTGKTIVPFCTSHSSGIGSSDTNLHSLASGANWLSGRRFAARTTRKTMETWIGGLDLPKAAEPAGNAGNFDLAAKSVTLNSGYITSRTATTAASCTGQMKIASIAGRTWTAAARTGATTWRSGPAALRASLTPETAWKYGSQTTLRNQTKSIRLKARTMCGPSFSPISYLTEIFLWIAPLSTKNYSINPLRQ